MDTYNLTINEKQAQVIAQALGDTVPPCKCNFKQKTAGDGCAICNPERAADYATDKTNETEGEV